MKRFHFTRRIKEARGVQIYSAEAETMEEAQEIVEDGRGTFVDEEVEIYDLDKPEFDFEEDIDE